MYITSVVQSERCHGICGSNLGCFGSLIENNDCGVDCDVSAINNYMSCIQTLIVISVPTGK